MSDDAEHRRLVSGTASRLFPDLQGLARARVEALLTPLVADWVEQAEGLEQSVVVEIGRADLAQKLADGPPEQRVSRLRAEVVARQVERLSARSGVLARLGAAGGTADPAELSRLDTELAELRSVSSRLEGEAVRIRLTRRLERAQLDLETARHSGAGPLSPGF